MQAQTPGSLSPAQRPALHRLQQRTTQVTRRHPNPWCGQIGNATTSGLQWCWRACCWRAACSARYSTANSVARRNSERSRESLELSAAEVASTLRVAILREADLAQSATAFYLRTPYATNDQFLAWADSVKALERYPELLGWGEVVMVTPEQLRRTWPRRRQSRRSRVREFEVIPPGDRPVLLLLPLRSEPNARQHRGAARLRLLRRDGRRADHRGTRFGPQQLPIGRHRN